MINNYQNQSFIGLSHRGNSKDFIENSFEAFDSVTKMGFKYIETDLRMTLDGEIIAFHDEDLKRLFKIDLKVQDLTYKEIDKLFGEQKCNLISLREFLTQFPDIKFNIDLKSKSVVKKSVEIVKELKAFDRVCFASFNSTYTQEVLNTNPNAIVSMGLTDVAYFKFFSFLNKKANILQIPLRWKGIKILNKSLIERAKKKRLLIHVWTINDRNVIYDLIKMGINGIVTDEPLLLMDIMHEKNLIPV
tara:strand:- start:1675 stop:2412 length:738 start_codon:yes stop_codon:yes gene_type:complete